jgi:hypothetical protein
MHRFKQKRLRLACDRRRKRWLSVPHEIFFSFLIIDRCVGSVFFVCVLLTDLLLLPHLRHARSRTERFSAARNRGAISGESSQAGRSRQNYCIAAVAQ